MNGRNAKAIRRSASRAIQKDLTKVCETFFNSLCDLPLKRRVIMAARIIIKRKLRAQ